MLTLGRDIQNAQDANHYFMETDNYYLSADEYKDRFRWWGIGAKKLGLGPLVESKDFLQMLAGKLPNGVQIAAGAKGKRRLGFDLSFAPPKSISILSLVYEKHELIEAHERAVEDAMAVIEKEAAQARAFIDGEVEYEKTGNLAVAQFLHDTSRDLDPHLHTHCFTLNCTERQDGKWRAMASNKGKIEEGRDGNIKGFRETVYFKQLYYGMIYASSLAKRVVELGYNIEVDEHSKALNFEIEGVPDELITHFSKRREAIKTRMNEMGVINHKSADFANLSTRKKKEAVDRGVLRKNWREDINKEFPDFNPDALRHVRPTNSRQDVPGQQERNGRENVTPDNTAPRNYPDSTEHLPENGNPVVDQRVPENGDTGQSVKPDQSSSDAVNKRPNPESAQSEQSKPLDRQDSVKPQPEQNSPEEQLAGRFKPGAVHSKPVPQEALDAVIAATEYFAESRLVFSYTELVTKAMQFSLGKTSFTELNNAIRELKAQKKLINLSSNSMTTRNILDFEKALLDGVNKTQGVAKPAKVNTKVLDKIAAPEHQKELVQQLLESEDSLSIVNMDLYSKPEAFIQAFLSTAEHSGKRVRVLAPTKLYTNELGQKINRRSFNAWHWVVNFLEKPELAKTVKGYLYQNLEKEPLKGFFNRAGRDILVVDSAHRLGNEDLAGLLSVIEAKQAKVVFLNTDQSLKGAAAGTPMEVLRRAKIREYALNEKGNGEEARIAVAEIAEDQVRAERIASKYADFTEAEQRDTHVLAHTHKQAGILNEEIRKALKAKGVLGQNEYALSTLSPVYLTRTEKTFATHYTNNMILKRFQKKGPVETYLVLKHFKEDNSVLLLNEAQEKIHWNPAKTDWKTGLYTRNKIGIVEGERLVTTDNMRHLGFENAQKLKVTKLDKKGAEIVNEATGEVLKLGFEDLHDCSLKHAYASTILGAERVQRSAVIADIKAFAASKEMLVELGRRAAKTVDILTDSEVRFKQQAEKAEVKLDATGSAIAVAQHFAELQKFINPDTVGDFKRDIDVIIAHLSEQFNGADLRSLSQRAIDYVIDKLSEREAAFPHMDLVKTALSFAMAEIKFTGEMPVDLMDLKAELAGYFKSGKLLASPDKPYWVTREALECERELLKMAKEGKGQVAPLLSKEDAFERLNNTHLTAGQKNAANLILTTADRFTIIQGDPGTGKTSMVTKVKEILDVMKQNAEDSGIELKGIAPTYQAVKELEAVGIPSQTLKSFLIEHAEHEKSGEWPDYSKTGFILDEYSMVSNRDDRDIDRIIVSSGSRISKFGDNKQFEAISQGKPMSVQLKAGIVASARMDELVRQQNEDAKDIAKAAIQGNAAGVFAATQKMDARDYIERDESLMTAEEISKLSLSVHEIKKSRVSEQNFDLTGRDHTSTKGIDELAEMEKLPPQNEDLNYAIAREYVLRTPEVRKYSPIIVQTHRNRELITGMIRDQLMENGELPSEGGMTLRRLVREDTLKTDIREALFKGSSHIRLGKNYYEIMEVDRKNKAMLLKGEDGKVTAFNTGSDLERFKENYEIFSVQTNELVPGDLIMLRKNDLKRGHRANIDHIVKSIEGKKLVLESTLDKSEVVLDSALLKDSHWDYAYTRTTYSMQGASRYYPIIHFFAGDDKMAHVRSLCIAATRHSHHCMIFTDDKQEVIERFSRPSDKKSALEAMGELPEEKVESPKESSVTERAPEQQKQHEENEQGVKIAPEKEKAEPQPQPEKPSVHAREKPPVQAERFDAKEIEMRLSEQAETIAAHLLGERNTKVGTAGDWRYGKKGSLSVKMSGDKRGSWHNFETGKGGHLLALIQEELGLDFKEALRYAANLVGGSPVEPVKRPQYVEKDQKKQPMAEWRQKQIQQLFGEAKPVEGTLAEKYLKEHRGITELSGLNVRFHDRVYSHKEEKEGKSKNVYHPALIVFCMKDENNPCGIQAIYLDEKTGGKRKDVPVDKRQTGIIGGFPVQLNKGKAEDRISFIAEGVETSASIRDSAPQHDVWATLSKENFGNLKPEHLGDTVVLCIDNDKSGTIKHGHALVKSIELLEQANKEVFVVMPKDLKDFNDVLKQKGRNGVIQEMNNKISGAAFKERMAHFESEKKLLDKAASREAKEKALDRISQKELDSLMKAFHQQKTKTPPVPHKEVHIQKERFIHDREIG